MNRLDRYILIEFIKGFFMGMGMFFLIFLLAESIKLTGWIIEEKFTFYEGVKYLQYGLPETLTNTAPLGILLGSLLCISKMAKQLEIIAMKTNGISFWRISFFPLVFSFIVSLFILYINYEILGEYNLKKSILKISKLSKGEPVKMEKDFVLVKIDKNRVLYANNVNKKNNEMKNIQIIEVDDNFQNIISIYTSSSAKKDIKTNNWFLKNLKKHDLKLNISEDLKDGNYNLTIPIEDVLADPVIPKNLTIPQLREKIVYFNRVGADIVDLLVDFYYRISFSFSSFVMVFIGLALGSRYVRGGIAVNIGTSVLIGYSYYGVSTILKGIAQSKIIPIYLACFLPLFIYFILGIKLFKGAEY